MDENRNNIQCQMSKDKKLHRYLREEIMTNILPFAKRDAADITMVINSVRSTMIYFKIYFEKVYEHKSI